jgi:hypothetical protein
MSKEYQSLIVETSALLPEISFICFNAQRKRSPGAGFIGDPVDRLVGAVLLLPIWRFAEVHRPT